MDSYPLDPGFERHVVLMLCVSSSFYGAFAEHLEDDAFKSQHAKNLVKACRLVYKDTGRGPGSALIVQQRLRRMHSEGKIAMDDLVDAVDYLLDAEDVADAPDEEVVAAEFKALVRRRFEGRVIEEGLMKFGQRGDLSEVAAQLQSAVSIGSVDVSLCDEGWDSLVADLDEDARVERLSLGAIPLDDALRGGAARGTLTFGLAPPKTGKSLWLVERSVVARRAGLNCVAVTLELSAAAWRARHYAGLTRTPTHDIMSSPSTTVARKYLEEVEENFAKKGKKLGRFGCKKFPGGVTSLDEILALVRRQEDAWGEPAHVLVVDYLDKLRGRDAKAPFHDQMRDVYERTRIWAEDHDRWAFTASQTQGHVKPGEMPKLNDCADSQGKVRVTDVMVGLKKHLEEEHTGMVSLKLLAVRNGDETGDVGPYPGGAEYGVFLMSVCDPVADVEKALKEMDDDE